MSKNISARLDEETFTALAAKRGRINSYLSRNGREALTPSAHYNAILRSAANNKRTYLMVAFSTLGDREHEKQARNFAYLEQWLGEIQAELKALRQMKAPYPESLPDLTREMILRLRTTLAALQRLSKTSAMELEAVEQFSQGHIRPNRGVEILKETGDGY